MSYFGTREWFLEVEQGNVAGWSHNRKFGKNFSATTTLAVISASGLYQTPTTAQSLEIVSSNANDTSAGTGARTITIVGLNSSWVETSVTVTMNGTTPVAVTGTWMRIYRMYIETTGTYGTSTASSQAGTITLRNSGAGVTWGLLSLDGTFGLGQSLIGSYTVPSGYTAYVYPNYISVESTKTITAYFFKRENANDVTIPYSPIRAQISLECIGGINPLYNSRPLGIFPAMTDIGWMAKTSTGTASISVSFDIYLKAD
jgi:hypothetical protein